MPKPGSDIALCENPFRPSMTASPVTVNDCVARHVVRIEPGLRPPSPENGNISACGGRLLAIPPRRWRNREAGDRSLNQKSPLLAGISPTIRDGFPEGRTAWLAAQC